MAKNLKLSLFTEYTPDELEAKGQELAEKTKERTAIEDQKAIAAKHFKEQIDRIGYDIAELADQVQARGEERLVDCFVQLYDPSQGFKSIYRLDTGEFCRTEQMSVSEMQDNLFPLTDDEPEPAAAVQEQGAGASADTEAGETPSEPAQDAPEDELEEEELPQPAAPDAEAAVAIDEAVDAAIEQQKPKVARPRGFAKSAYPGVQ